MNLTFGCPLPQMCPLAEPGQGIEESVGAKRRHVMLLKMKSIQCDFSTNIVDEE